MKHAFAALAIVSCLFPLTMQAQTTVDLDPELGGRVSVSAEKRLAKGLHVALEEEVRMADNFGSLGRLQTTVSADYKLLNYFKLGTGYSLIMPYSSKNAAFKSFRHRLLFDAQASYRMGDWSFSLKERLQLTFRTGDYNEYQHAAMAATLKSRLKVKYHGWRRITPYASLEMRTFLNAPVVSASTDGTLWYTPSGDSEGEAGWFLAGWNGVYNNRYRVSLGADYRLAQKSMLGVYVLLDFLNDRAIDANASGTKLKSYTCEQGFVGWLGVEYKIKL